VSWGESATLAVVVSNAGSGPGDIDGIKITEPFSAEDLHEVIQGGATREIQVTFDATDPLDAAGSLAIFSDDVPTGRMLVSLEGDVAVQAIGVEPPSLEFEVEKKEEGTRMIPLHFLKM